MQSATAKMPTLFPISAITIAEGLRDLVSAFEARQVTVASITLNRAGKSYRHVVDDTQQGIQRPVEGRYTDTTIVVTVLSPMEASINAELQTATTAAATAAVEWLDEDETTDVASNTARTPIVASSPTMIRLDREISRVAASNHIVLVTGESGTGKTTAAQLIHDRSSRSKGPFVDINCAALPDTLVESELFGYERGAFTGAVERKQGLFEVAAGGTLFLDEIGELKLELQAKLLKAIEQQKIRRLGGTKDIRCNVRILAASSRNLQRMVKAGTFREDLYYRLAVLEIYIPPLRERQDDIRQLVEQQLKIEQRNAKQPHPFKIETLGVSELVAYSWPGNIRQLHNVIARLTCNANPGQTITALNVRAEISRFQELDGDTLSLPDSCSTLLSGESLDDFSTRVRRAAIECVKARTNGNMSRVAQRLKVDRSSLLRIVQRINSRREGSELTEANDIAA
jgi:transcriptional regulator with PAS, ATPase and Fis domain